jgi:GntR family transcriptional regulator
MVTLKAKALNIQIVTGDARPIFKQIVDGVRMEIATGRVVPGDPLPSYRGLAMQLMVNPNTVAKAYAQLANQGLVESRKGLGLFVAEPRQILSRNEKEQRLTRAIDGFINETLDLDYGDDEIIERLKQILAKLKAKRKN